MITKLLLGAILALGLGNLGQYFWHQWQVRSYEKQVQELQAANLALDIEVKAKQAALDYKAKQTQIQKRVSHEKEEIDEQVDHGSLDDLRNLYGRYRVHEKGYSSPQDGRGPGGPGNQSPGPAGVKAVHR